ncbi:GNAT family N-acetyltransferase [Thermocrispum sp.]|uniref:GNAT family N-acetyltransferase n=1 Tax=Thermocrispum sp. TaxID=2060768 RepID=UPI00257FEF99|nr:GNAT family N-acetyltransferase [Thermocrispum sp.]
MGSDGRRPESTAGADPSAGVAAQVTVRVARPEEYRRAGELVFEAYDADGHVAADPDPEFGAELRDAATRAEHGDLLVAEGPGGRLLGTVTVVLPGSPLAEVAQPGEAELRMLATDRAARGRGVGTALLEAAIARARAANARRIVLSTLPTMTAAHRMYARRGFVRAPHRDWEPAPDYPLLVFELEL